MPDLRDRLRRPAAPAVLALALAAATLAACGSDAGDDGAAATEVSAAAADTTTPTTASGAAAGTDHGGEAAFPLTVADCSRQLELAARPEAVLTVGMSAASLLHAAGASDRIVGRAGEFGAELSPDLAAAIGDVAVIDDFDPTLEAIVAADPDLVLGYGLFNTEAADVEAAGISTLTVTGECGHSALPADKAGLGNFEVMLDDIRTYGGIFGTADEAAAAADALEARIEAVKADPPVTDGTTAAGVYFFGGALSVTGAHNMLHDQMTALGLTDAYADLAEGFAEVSIESLLEVDPDVIILNYGFDGDDFEQAKAQLLAQPGAADLAAVKTDRIIGLAAVLRGPDPGAVDGLEQLASELAAA